MAEEYNDDELKKLEDDLKKLEDSDGDYGAPETTPKDSIFRFFREIISSTDSKKIGNLSKAELGVTKLGVRHFLELSQYAAVEGLDRVALYLEKRAEISLATSLSREGFLLTTAVTQIKKEQKIKEPLPQGKKPWFGPKKQEEE